MLSFLRGFCYTSACCSNAAPLRASSSAGQSWRLITAWSRVQVLPGPPNVCFQLRLGTFVLPSRSESGLLPGCMVYSTQPIGIQGGSVMRTEKKSHRARMDPIVTLVLIFAVLKVTGLISWPWLWVLSPIWITLLIFAAIFSFILVGGRIVKGKW